MELPFPFFLFLLCGKKGWIESPTREGRPSLSPPPLPPPPLSERCSRFERGHLLRPFPSPSLFVVSAIVGAAGLSRQLAALQAGQGRFSFFPPLFFFSLFFMPLAEERGVPPPLIPWDSGARRPSFPLPSVLFSCSTAKAGGGLFPPARSPRRKLPGTVTRFPLPFLFFSPPSSPPSIPRTMMNKALGS